MKIITYFGFTILSIFIQFCVMDFIQETLRQNTGTLDLNFKQPKQNDINYIVYNSTQQRKVRKTNSEEIIQQKRTIYTNTSKLIQPHFSTEMTSTIMDIFYDENVSTTDFTFTTELFTNTDIDNITEINFKDFKPTTIKPDIKRKSINKYCKCNLLHEICDINCCCDNDCSIEEQNIFHCNKLYNKSANKNDGACAHYLFHNNERYRNNMFDDMFCIIKINLPEKRQISHKKESLSHQYFKWRNDKHLGPEQTFTKNMYEVGDPVWLLRNGSVSYFELPSTLINNYCSKRKPLLFLKDEEIQCIVKFNDLEMFHIFNLEKQTNIISVTNVSNSSILNCSTVHCANWSILICDDAACEHYNRSVHEPSCTGTTCTNLALMADYTFYTHGAKIMYVTIKLYVEKIIIVQPYMTQKIRVNFLFTNTSIDNIVKCSGNPGYQHGLKVIISWALSNYTENFYNSRNNREIYFSLPDIRNRQCLIRNITDNFIMFGVNKRIKCRYTHKDYRIRNNDVCRNIQDNIYKLLFLNITMAVSAYGHPQQDNEWIFLNNNDTQKNALYAKVDNKVSKIFCYNLATKVIWSFAFTNLNEKGNKILSVKQQVLVTNKSFTIEDIKSTVITIDISFTDVTKPAVFEYASNPHLDINLPKDFFFPSNKSRFQCSNVYLVVLYCCIIIFK